VVFTVREETAAERAGIAEGDVIVSYAGKQVESFEQLTEMIGDNAAGETVTIELQRGAERITKRITLGAW
jgi:serine protease Do